MSELFFEAKRNLYSGQSRRYESFPQYRPVHETRELVAWWDPLWPGAGARLLVLRVFRKDNNIARWRYTGAIVVCPSHPIHKEATLLPEKGKDGGWTTGVRVVAPSAIAHSPLRMTDSYKAHDRLGAGLSGRKIHSIWGCPVLAPRYHLVDISLVPGWLTGRVYHSSHKLMVHDAVICALIWWTSMRE